MTKEQILAMTPEEHVDAAIKFAETTTPEAEEIEERRKFIEVFYKDFNDYNDIDVKFEDVYQYHHQQLQKAREEERERIIKLIDWRGKGFHSGSEVVAWIDEQLKTLNHSELDQEVNNK